MPTCSKCNEPSVAWIRYSGQQLCSEHFLRFFDKRAKAEISQQGRLPEGTIAVALSGGKDSVAALHWMERITRTHPRVDLVAITIDEGIAGYRDTAIEICRDLTKQLDIPWHTVTTKEMAGYPIDEYAAGEAGPNADGNPRPACGACGIFRREGMNKLALELGASAVVTGHNLDDMAQTVLMNHMKGDVDRLARLAPHTSTQPGLVPRLVPFRNIPEKEVLLYGILNDLPIHDEAECPYAVRAHRFEMRDMLVAMEERHPGTRHALLRGADRIKELIPRGEGFTAGKCEQCGGPSSSPVCKVCVYKA